MGLLTQEDVAGIQAKLKDAEAAMKSSQVALDKSKLELADLFGELNSLSDAMSKEQKTIDTETDNVNSYESIIKDTNVAIKDKDAGIDAAKAAGNDTLAKQLEQEKAALQASLSDTKSKKDTSLAALDKAQNEFTHLQDSYNTVKNAITNVQAEKTTTEADLDKHTKDFNEYSNSTVLAQFEEETKTRKEHAKGTVRNKERIKVLLEDKNDTVNDKLTEMNSDSNIFVEDIKRELEFTPAAESKLERIQSALDGSDSLFTARQAFDLASESVYSTKAIVEKIKKACYAGQTSIDLLESEVSGTQILMLDKVGYKITHAKNNKLYEQDDLIVTVDWGFAQEN
jgi:chromosome segregation ATPase